MPKEYTFSPDKFGRSVTVQVPTYEEAKERARVYVWDYGMKQSLSDSFSGAKDDEDFEAKLRKRADAINAGNVSVGSGRGPRLDPVERELKTIIADRLKAFIESRKRAGKPKPSAELQQVWLDRNIETMRESAARIVAEREAMDVEFDLEDMESDDESDGSPTFDEE